MLGDVRRWVPGEIEAAADAAAAHRTTLTGLQDELDATARPSGWEGEAASAADSHRAELTEMLRRTAAQVGAVGRGLDEAGASLTAVHTLLAESESLATTWEFALGDDNQVRDTTPPGTQLTEAVLADRTRMQTELVDRVGQICRTAADTDADLSQLLRWAAGDHVDDGAGTTLASAADTGAREGGLSALAPPLNGTPTQNAAWWGSLTPTQQRALVDEHPETVGNLDGVPASVRDTANRARLGTERARTEAEISRLQGQLDDHLFGGLLTNEDAALEHAKNRLSDLDAIEQTLTGDDRHLLLLDNSGEMVKAAIANGDVDTADNVSVSTSGLNSSTRGNLEGYDGDMNRMRGEVEHQLQQAGRGSETVATVTWMGYEPPSGEGLHRRQQQRRRSDQ